ncbi:hypothetical protein EYF80_014857 [Liparis tanakae]|uniref:Uncharacterized protein n=1 Tax=Liparis tanakae TaxID=230148 RepID=A0A4Z2IA37_9TELE|nr:hypothetical protein EYF80_014857 [Liparis tanakae]
MTINAMYEYGGFSGLRIPALVFLVFVVEEAVSITAVCPCGFSGADIGLLWPGVCAGGCWTSAVITHWKLDVLAILMLGPAQFPPTPVVGYEKTINCKSIVLNPKRRWPMMFVIITEAGGWRGASLMPHPAAPHTSQGPANMSDARRDINNTSRSRNHSGEHKGAREGRRGPQPALMQGDFPVASCFGWSGQACGFGHRKPCPTRLLTEESEASLADLLQGRAQDESQSSQRIGMLDARHEKPWELDAGRGAMMITQPQMIPGSTPGSGSLSASLKLRRCEGSSTQPEGPEPALCQCVVPLCSVLLRPDLQHAFAHRGTLLMGWAKSGPSSDFQQPMERPQKSGTRQDIGSWRIKTPPDPPPCPDSAFLSSPIPNCWATGSRTQAYGCSQ